MIVLPDELLKNLLTLIQEKDWEGLRENARRVYPHDLADFIVDLEEELQREVMANLDEGTLAEMVPELPEEKQREFIEFIPPKAGADLLERLRPDEMADILDSLAPEKRREIFKHLPEEKKKESRELLKYSPESAGGLMTPEVLTLDQGTTVKDAIEYIRQEAREYEIIYYAYVTDKKDKLVGVLSLRDLVLVPLEERLRDLMNPEVIKVNTDMDQEEVSHVMADYNLMALPVVDKNDMLLGIITHDDIVDVIREEATEDITIMGGVQPLEESYLTSSTSSLFRKRIVWLILLLLGQTVSMGILRAYESALTTMIALVFFIPLIIGTAGNAGAQSSTLVIRSLALGESGEKDFFRILRKELGTGALLGIGVAAFSLPWSSVVGNVSILVGMTVFVSLMIVITISTCIGGTLPILAEKIGYDPAVLSSPFLTTFIDSLGLLIYFSVAKVVLGI